MAEQLELFPQETLESQGSVELPTNPIIEDVEWCFQFFNNEPVVFAFSNEGEPATPLQMKIEPIEGDGLNFQQNGMLFKIFPRPISESTKIERKNESENKEA
jgi:hypothetical protein